LGDPDSYSLPIELSPEEREASAENFSRVVVASKIALAAAGGESNTQIVERPLTA